MEQKFFICEHCGNIVAMVKPSGVPIVCCGKIMKELIPGTTDASVEKHVPVYKVDNGRVEVVVGDVIHPMVEEHFIEWIYVKCGTRTQGITLTYKDKPYAEFYGDWKGKVEVQASCNLHGLWLSTIIC